MPFGAGFSQGKGMMVTVTVSLSLTLTLTPERLPNTSEWRTFAGPYRPLRSRSTVREHFANVREHCSLSEMGLPGEMMSTYVEQLCCCCQKVRMLWPFPLKKPYAEV